MLAHIIDLNGYHVVLKRQLTNIPKVGETIKLNNLVFGDVIGVEYDFTSEVICVNIYCSFCIESPKVS